METNLKLKTISYEDCTIGRLYVGSRSFFTVELPWLDNEQDVSCISPGVYPWKKRLSPGKGYVVIELTDVPNRTYIQIHMANRTAQLLGCIAPGMAIKDYNTDGIPDVIDSEPAFKWIMDNTAEAGTIEIERML